MDNNSRAIMIAAPESGAGKTSISLGLMAAFKDQGRAVQPFKVGPDYIDPGFHRHVCSRPSHNLDSWLISPSYLRYLWTHKIRDADIAIVEGVMGLYDGAGPDTNRGSSAEIAEMLDIPVLLVIDAGGMARSAAALVSGYSQFSRDINLAGVIANRVGSRGHYELVAEAVEKETGIPCVGYLPRDLPVDIPERHLGLVPAAEIERLEESLDRLGREVSEKFQLNKIMQLSEEAGLSTKDDIREQDKEKPAAEVRKGLKFLSYSRSSQSRSESTAGKPGRGLRIGVARDEAFSFHYQANLDLLIELGCELIEFSPLADKKLETDLDGIYLAGGFPEVFAEELSANKSFRRHLKEELNSGLVCFAECGGFMYLLAEICSEAGECQSMVGYFPGRAVMTDSLQNFGYVEVDLPGNPGLRGHEFHYSRLEGAEGLPFRGKIKQQRRGEERQGMAVKNNVLAGYPHLHFYSNPEFLAHWLNLCAGEVNSWL